MQGDATVIQHLNAVLRNEMTAVNQYFLHARMLEHWGAVRLGAHEYEELIDEMKHADLLIKRLLFLGGEPRLEFDKLLIGMSVPEVLECDLRLEQLAMPQLREAIPYCEGVRDFVTRDLFSEILKGEEEHVDFLETQLELIDPDRARKLHPNAIRAARIAARGSERREPAMSATTQRYNVGGIYLQRPFKIRRLGHFGFNVEKLPEGREFYGDLLGFTASDTLDFSRAPWFPKDADLGDPRGYFMRYGTDHHAFVLFPKRVMDHRADRKFAPEVTINQITWQCGSLKEIVDAHTYFEEQQVRIQRVGRDMPGSNWHVYVYDPDGHTNEFYYGIEQVGWNRLSKPRDMYYRGFNEKPPLPQMSEAAELAEAIDKGIDVFSGHRPQGDSGRDLRRRRRIAAAPVQDHQGRPGQPVCRRRRPRREFLYRAPRLCAQRRGGLSRRPLRVSALRRRTPQRRALSEGAAAHTGPQRAYDLHVVRGGGRQLCATARGRRLLEGAWRHLCRLDPARALPRHRLFGLCARPGRPLHPALLLHGADRLGWPGAPGLRAAPRRAGNGRKRWNRFPTPTSTRCSRARWVSP